MSLRARLLGLLVAVAAVGLVVLAAVTYAEQRSFLVQRIDDQTNAALPAVNRQLDGEREGFPPPLPGFRLRGGGPGRGFAPPPGARGPGAELNLPPGTYGQRRGPTGRVVAHVVLTYGQIAPPAPKLPRRPALGEHFTVDAVGGSGLRYRVLAVPTFDQPGRTTIVAIPLREIDDTLHRLLLVEALVIAGVLVVLVASAWWLVRLGLRPLDRMGRTADAIAAGDLSQRVSPADERTEVGRLGLALNSMLTQIEKAFAERQASENRLRQFLADASHELRTPLASIRGYSELFRIGASRDARETEKAMRRIEEESARMGVLVEDLLTLARLDQLPETVREPVCLDDLARDAAEDARAAAPDRMIELDAAEGVQVLGNGSQLRQVIGNLVRNALTHTPPGTRIDLRVARDGGDAVIEVRDHGHGLPSEDTAALFDRFWRAQRGRNRGPAGAGLGLSIVAAIVEAHAGRVQATNADGDGAIFRVRLPAHVSAPPAPVPTQ